MTVRLTVFGGLSLQRDDGDAAAPIFAQRHPRAFLALLDTAGTRGLSREKLQTFLWPERDSESAAHSLSQVLYVLRRALGGAPAVVVGDQLRIDRALVKSDLDEFREALAQEDLERAVTLYTGPFLDGFFLPGADEFERWAAEERNRHERACSDALERVAVAASARSNAQLELESWRRLVAIDPHNSRFALSYMNALAASGSREAALGHARVHRLRLREELGVDPQREVLELEERLRTATSIETHATDIRTPRPRASASARSSKAADRRAGAESEAAAPGTANAPAIGVNALAPEVARPSVAVLPLANIGGLPENEYLSDGITEEIISTLALMPALRVVARTSVFAFKDRPHNIRKIARALDAQVLIDGSVRRFGDRLRVVVHLVSGLDGFHRWTKRYDRSIADVFSIEDDIARSVAHSLALTVLGTERSLSSTSSSNPRAHEAYWRGRFYLNKRTPQAMRDAIASFQESLSLDAAFAVAHAALAEAYALLCTYGAMAPREGMPLARASAQRAVSFAPALGEAHATLGRITALYDWDWAGASDHFTRALELNTNNATAYQWKALDTLLPRGAFDAARENLGRACALDPLSPILGLSRGLCAYFAGDPAAAAAEHRAVLGLDENFGMTHFFLGWALLETGELDEAVRELEQARDLEGGSTETIAVLAYALARRGDHLEAQRFLDGLAAEREHRYVPASQLALVELGLGNSDRALTWLEKAVDERAPEAVWLGVRPVYSPLRSTRRFQELIDCVGLQRRPATGGD
jgi:TolB-like protein/DNA-binding SARP family transcriptional activator/Flp pilus assembly protein TadD